MPSVEPTFLEGHCLMCSTNPIRWPDVHNDWPGAPLLFAVKSLKMRVNQTCRVHVLAVHTTGNVRKFKVTRPDAQIQSLDWLVLEKIIYATV